MRKTHAPRTWYISEHPEYRAKVDFLRKLKSKLDVNSKPCSPEKHALKNERRKQNG
jgi:hypothetical protein